MPISKPHGDIDELDEAIIAQFQLDAEQSNIDVARKLDVSEGTIRSRLKVLLAKKIICFDVALDIKAAGLNFGAWVKASVQPAHLQNFLDHAKKLPEIWYLARATGSYNVVGFISTASQEDAYGVISGGLETLPGLNRIETRPVVMNKKTSPMETTIIGSE